MIKIILFNLENEEEERRLSSFSYYFVVVPPKSFLFAICGVSIKLMKYAGNHFKDDTNSLIQMTNILFALEAFRIAFLGDLMNLEDS